MTQPKEQTKPQSFYTLRNFTVVLVEDYEFIRNLASSMLKVFGIGNIIVCKNAKEAIQVITLNNAQVMQGTTRPIDMILTDWMMPEGSGQELIQWMRNHKSEQIRFMPVILLTTFASEKVVLGGRDLGVNEILVKPVSAQKIATRILSIIDNPRPFVKTLSFFGPDRRRKDISRKGEERRKMDADHIVKHDEADAA